MYTFHIHDIYYLLPLIVAIFAQLIKVIIDMRTWKKLWFYSLLSSGGMPSTHTTITSSLLVMIILFDGLFNVTTMVVTVFALLIRYDAANVRYESGKHAQYINSLKYQIHQVMNQEHIPEVSSYLAIDKLRERLWHTPIEIFVGILFGVGVTLWLFSLIDSYIVPF